LSEEASDTYRTLVSKSESLYKVKGSKHFGYAFPVYSVDEVKPLLEEIKKEHHTARHHCYAYRIGLEKDVYRANDDGEPSGTAGKPILGQIQSFDLTNIFIVVVRYFGGTKLGVGGLIDAYRTSAKEAIEAGTIIARQVKSTYTVTFGYEQMGEVMAYLKNQGLEFYQQVFESQCSLLIDIRNADGPRLENELGGIYGVEVEFLKTA
jgi:uncharacterized YigZ family protein